MSNRMAALTGMLTVAAGLAVGVCPAAQVALYETSGPTAFSPELYGWYAFGVTGPADARSVTDTLGGAAAAWQISDSQVGGAAPQYYLPLGGRDLSEALSQGWRMTATARLVSPSAAAPTMGLGVYFDGAAYLLQLDLEGGELVASLWDSASPVSILSERLTGAADATAYHDFELRWSPNDRLAALYFDGRHITDWDGVPTTHTGPGNLYQFGASSTGGSGVMNFRRVEFATLTTASTGDYNGDGAVNAADYTVWRDQLGGTSAAADGNGDGRVTQDDYAVWRSHFGTTASASDVSAVPAPSSRLLLGGLAAAFSRRCRERVGSSRR